jgi:hypothetical protein
MNIMQLFQSGMNPKSAIQNLMNSNPEVSQNPIAQNAMRMAQNNDISGLRSMAQNLYRERGLDINQAYNQISSMMNFSKH